LIDLVALSLQNERTEEREGEDKQQMTFANIKYQTANGKQQNNTKVPNLLRASLSKVDDQSCAHRNDWIESGELN
jgi:hypothetical protein